MKRIFDLTMQSMKETYDNELAIAKKRMKEMEDRMVTMKKLVVKKEKEVQKISERWLKERDEGKVRVEHAELLLRLAGALEDGAKGVTKGGGKLEETRY